MADLKGTRNDDRLIGTDEDDTIRGGRGDDVLSGEGGRDRLAGGPGIDRLRGGDGNDVLSGGDGIDRLGGGAGDDRLFSGDEGDVLRGHAGADLLRGGRGADTLYGGAGEDTFVVRLRDLDLLRDHLPDFTLLEDKIDLSEIDANEAEIGDQAFDLVGALTGQAGQIGIIPDLIAGVTQVLIDLNGDAQADLEMIVGTLIGADDFIL
jgi:Ca2+-binding RTX toxin-like protein